MLNMKFETIGRRRPIIATLATAALATAALTLTPFLAQAAAADAQKPIVVGTIEDVTGAFTTYGLPVVKAQELAVKEINQSGGLLGRQIKLIVRDSKSDISNYSTFANELILNDKIDVLFAGVLSSSREALRPIVRRHNLLYFYTSNYEGGVCDKNVFLTGTTPSQKMQFSIKYMVDTFGPKIFSVPADYNYGHLENKWLKTYADQTGGKVVQTEFIPLTGVDFSTTVGKIQKEKPDWIFAATAGDPQLQFYRQLAAAGGGYGVLSEDFGQGNEQVSLPPSAGKGIITASNWVPGLTSEKAQAFTKLWYDTLGKDAPVISDQAMSVWNAWHLWAAAVEKAGTTKTDAVIKALESGISYDGPAGKVTIDGPSHHVIEDVVLVKVNDQHGFDLIKTFRAVPPSYEQKVCDLIKHPNTRKQFSPD